MASEARANGSDPIIATSPGITSIIEIRASTVKRYLEAHTTQSPEEAVRRLIDFEVLAQLARQRNLQQRPLVKDERTKALALAYLRRIFEPTWSSEAVPEADLKRVYDINLVKFVHPNICNPDHILIGHRPEKGMVLPKDPKLAASAKRIIFELYDKLKTSPPSDQVAFLQSFRPFEKDAKANGLLMESQTIGFFSLEKGPLSRGIDPEFARRTFALKAGELSEPFSTVFGWHIVRQFDCKSAQNQSYLEARPSIAKRILGDVRKRELGRLSLKLAEAYPPASEGVGLRRLIRLQPLLRAEEKHSIPDNPN